MMLGPAGVRDRIERAERSPPEVTSSLMASLAIGNPWLGWGLTRDPYFQEALTPEADSLHPADRLHVGREDVPHLGDRLPDLRRGCLQDEIRLEKETR